MDNEQRQQPFQRAAPNETPTPTVPTAVTKWQNPYEITLLIFGIVAVFSLLTGNGDLLRIAAIVFLLVSLYSIARGVPLRGEPVTTTSDGKVIREKHNWTPLRIIGLSILVVIGLPILGYLALIAMFMVLMISGVGEAGT
ncbi:hypothetical protein IRY61_02250 [Candidatus Saccharibacteria bacterium]|nr:hypothetical protein [Candidatus Saccharibacteria bacterium]